MTILYILISLVIIIMSAKYLGPILFNIGLILSISSIVCIKFGYIECSYINQMEWYYLPVVILIGAISLPFIVGILIGFLSFK